MKAKQAYLITQPIFGVKETSEGKKEFSHSAIINFGKDLGDNLILFYNNKGKQIKNISTLPSSIQVYKFEDICLDTLMDSWKRKNNFYKPVILDEAIDTLETNKIEFSSLEIMIERREDAIAIKPIFKDFE